MSDKKQIHQTPLSTNYPPMKLFKKFTNGIVLVFIGLLHTQCVLTNFQPQFKGFSETWFFNISKGIEQLPAVVGKTDFESFATFWFLYFGLLIIPLGFLVHAIERKKDILPLGFTLSYLIVVLIGVYMVPNSGMTFIMLPHALYMLISSLIKQKKAKIY